MRRVFEFICKTTGSRVIRCFLNEINESESTFTELSQDSESIIVDPNITTTVYRTSGFRKKSINV
jgi:hypothetical protein